MCPFEQQCSANWLPLIVGCIFVRIEQQLVDISWVCQLFCASFMHNWILSDHKAINTYVWIASFGLIVVVLSVHKEYRTTVRLSGRKARCSVRRACHSNGYHAHTQTLFPLAPSTIAEYSNGMVQPINQYGEKSGCACYWLRFQPDITIGVNMW